MQNENVMEASITVAYDPTGENPREWDNLGTMVYWHHRYCLGDVMPKVDPQEFLRTLEPAIILPLNMYEHGGIVLSVRMFNDPWDSGQVGWIYVTREKVREAFGVKRISANLESLVRKQLADEVETFNKYVNGEVFEYRISVTTPTGSFTDGCSGFFSYEEAFNMAMEDLKHAGSDV